MTIVVSAPTSTSPWLATFERNGAQLAADQINAHHSLKMGGKTYRVDIKVLDNGGLAAAGAANARQAVSMHAAALIIDGVGAAAVADITDAGALPMFVVFEGGAGIVDPERRPTMFRLAPADKYMTMRLADYLAGRHPKVGIIADDTSYGHDGLDSLTSAFGRDEITVAQRPWCPPAAATSRRRCSRTACGGQPARRLGVAPVVAAVAQAARSRRLAGADLGRPDRRGPAGTPATGAASRLAHRRRFVSFRITARSAPHRSPPTARPT